MDGCLLAMYSLGASSLCYQPPSSLHAGGISISEKQGNWESDPSWDTAGSVNRRVLWLGAVIDLLHILQQFISVLRIIFALWRAVLLGVGCVSKKKEEKKDKFKNVTWSNSKEQSRFLEKCCRSWCGCSVGLCCCLI